MANRRGGAARDAGKTVAVLSEAAGSIPAMTKSKWQLAYDAFRTDLSGLLTGGFGGKWVLYHGAQRIAIDENRDHLYQVARDRRLSEEEIFVDLITLQPEDIDAEIDSHR